MMMKKKKNDSFLSRFFKGFLHAFEGIFYTFKTQNNFRFHSIIALLVIGLAFYFKVTNTEWLILLLVIALVLSAELFNTALESITDLVSPEYHRLAKITKDTAAGAVLVLAIASIAIGLLIFWPYFSTYFF